MFRKYECGCVGFEFNSAETDASKRRVRCFQSCDGDEREHAIYERHGLSEKESRPLTDDEVEMLFNAISPLVDDGYAMRELRTALAVAGITVRR